jgi:hypothetical protein
MVVVVVVVEVVDVVVVESAPLTLATPALTITSATTTRGSRRMKRNYFVGQRRGVRRLT